MKERQGKKRQGNKRQEKKRQGKKRQEKKRQGNKGQEKKRQGKKYLGISSLLLPLGGFLIRHLLLLRLCCPQPEHNACYFYHCKGEQYPEDRPSVQELLKKAL